MGAEQTDLVEIRLPADSAYVATLRVTATSLAARSELTVDDLDELAGAVDEACALLLPLAGPSAVLTGSFVPAPSQLSVTLSVPRADGAQVDRAGLPWMVLGAFAQDVQVGGGDGTVTISFTRRRLAPLS